ncbi:MAG: hypothetical protein RR461_04920 [Angelakisella sp.]
MKTWVWKRWICIASALLLISILWYGVMASLPKLSLNAAAKQGVTAVSFLVEDGEYGSNRILLQKNTLDPVMIQKVLKRLNQERFYYDVNGGKGRSGEYMLILIDTVDNDCKTWQLKKSTDGTITIDYEGKKYFLECFSEEKELNLYNSLFQLVSELPPASLAPLFAKM